ncbi:uncharacterized protein BX664DRAFT_322793 [Halteromyces radiatus]|uniref:uncharacterized protein n=1 Tax=Halteromyces radiatus TaxID=101107 RepID=UPI00221EDAA6|nr:uncharacterized protein BX664DRAFT_322793 [Halteromyces radiatus]KAI8100073.1 hypothetical protein BX664DRAFT_322793 [Halteromyces radiatus]
MASTKSTDTTKPDDSAKEWLSPAQRHNMTETEKRQRQLDKLFENIDNPVFIPEPKREKKEHKVKDFVRNVSGSSAGAGSGDFHVYRALRRREYARLGNMEAEERKEREDKAYFDEMERKRLESEERTAKKRARRQKRKQAKIEKEDEKDNKKQKTQDQAK